MQKARKAGRSGILFLLMLFVLTFAIGTTSVEAATVKLNKTSATVYVGKTVTLKVSGTATITIKDTKGNKYTCKVTVKVGKLSSSSTSLIKGATKTLTLSNVDIKSVKSSKTSVATVSKTASRKLKITAKKSGTATITVTDKYGNTYTCKVTVKVGSLSASTASINVGSTKTLTISNVTVNSVSSSNTSVATVSKTSSTKVTITAKKAGTATITATAADGSGKSASCAVTVNAAEIDTSGNTIELDVAQEVSIIADDEVSAEYTYTPSKTGYYYFAMTDFSVTDPDSGLWLCEDGSYITGSIGHHSYDEDDNETYEAYIIYQLTAGVKYTYTIQSYEAYTCKILLQEFSFGLESVTGDVKLQSLTYYKNYANIYLYGDTLPAPEFDLTCENDLTVKVVKIEDYVYGDVVELVYLTDDSGNTYQYDVYYYLNPSVFEVQGVSGDGEMAITYSYYGNTSGYIDIYGTASVLMDSFALSLGDGVTYAIQELEDDYAYVQLTYNGVATYYLEINYYYDATLLYSILDVSGADITRYSTGRGSSSGYLYIYGLTTSMPEFALSLNDGVSYTVSTDDGVINMTYGDSTYVYYIY